MQIYIKNLEHTNIPIMVETSETVATLKQKIYELEKIPPDWQELTLDPKVSDTPFTQKDDSDLPKFLPFAETKLEDTKTMSYYKIEEQQIISLDIRLHHLNEEIAMKVYIHRPGRPHRHVDMITLYVESWWTIRFVKIILRYFCVLDKSKVMDEFQTLQFQKVVLDNDMTIADCNIQNEDRLEIVIVNN
ncbi:hypothetical protein SUGI_0798470 [Cryptomeria japonica]|nr:hypothetical protein SUGI_0798470 [Cryptomeria japonica]